MVTLGIDSGSNTTKAVVFDGKRIVRTKIVPTSANPRKSIYELYRKLYNEEIVHTVATGYGRELLQEADFQVTEITCHAKGSIFLAPETRGIIDVGGQDSKVIAMGNRNQPTDFLMNDKCAAGTGRFIENIFRILEIEIDQLDEVAKSHHPIEISSMCTVFAESEVIGLLANDVPPGDIAMGIIHAMAKRTANFAKRLPLENSVFFSGGLANSKAIAQILETYLETSVNTHALGQYAGAIGAAVIGWEKGRSHGKN